MKKILLILFFALVCFTTLTNAQVITKTASVSSAHVGEIFEYTIKISGVTNLSDLGKVVDVLDPSLTYISSDFATSSQIFAFYSMYCPSTISSLNEATSGTTHTFNFPASPPCSGSVVGGYGDFSFKIKVSVNEGACSELKIINSAKLYNQAGTNTFPSLVSKIDIDNSNPWTLKKTFRSFTGGYLIYDIRLSSSVKHYNANVLPYTQFSDDFVTEDCMNVTSAGSEVVYIEDESNLSSTTTLPGATIAVSSGSVSLNWSLPTPTTSPTLSSYLFQVKIKVNCTCPGTFDLKNHVNLTATDICSKDFELNDDFDLIKATCKGAPPIPKVCVSKQVKLIDNDLNLTMSGCKGNYIIKIENCTDSFTYTDIVFTDVFPSSSLLNINTSGITISPATYSLTTTATSITLNSISTPLLPGQIITITIPFTVATPLPNEFIQNCADATITMKDGVRPYVIKTEHFCDAGIITVPNNIAIIKDKQICNPPIHTCGTNTINNNLPGDIVEYALHIYNYGTGQADNVVVTDNLPPYFNLLDVKVYKAGNYGNVVSDICTIPSVFEDITGRCAFPPILGNKIQIKFSATDNLDKFTCEGVTHYIIKIKAKIAATVPNGSYTNVFETQYYDVTAGLTKSELSNPVTSVVNKDKLVIFDKHITSTTPDCVNKTSKVDYEIVVVNMGYDPIAVNIK